MPTTRSLLTLLLSSLVTAACVDAGDLDPLCADEVACEPIAADPTAARPDQQDLHARPIEDDRPPIAGTDRAATDEDTTLEVPLAALLANDVDPEGAALAVERIAGSAGGSAAIVGRALVFTPKRDHSGPAHVDYVVTDGLHAATGVLALTIAPIDDAPKAFDASHPTTVGQPVVFGLPAVEVDGQALTVELGQLPVHGLVTVDGDKYRYQPKADWAGSDKLTFRVSDGTTWSAFASVTFEVSLAP